MSARMGRLSAVVGCRHPVTIQKASLTAVSVRQVFALLNQTGAQYSAVEWTVARVLFAALFPSTSAKGVNTLISFHNSSKRQLKKLLNN